MWALNLLILDEEDKERAWFYLIVLVMCGVSFTCPIKDTSSSSSSMPILVNMIASSADKFKALLPFLHFVLTILAISALVYNLCCLVGEFFCSARDA
jgi:hypothetical protein